MHDLLGMSSSAHASACCMHEVVCKRTHASVCARVTHALVRAPGRMHRIVRLLDRMQSTTHVAMDATLDTRVNMVAWVVLGMGEAQGTCGAGCDRRQTDDVGNTLARARYLAYV